MTIIGNIGKLFINYSCRTNYSKKQLIEALLRREQETKREILIRT